MAKTTTDPVSHLDTLGQKERQDLLAFIRTSAVGPDSRPIDEFAYMMDVLALSAARRKDAAF